ncbi:hypothetical protein [Caldimonas tepidiphila]|uniref:hypothetical protein n=1 Tax=Caldimonas tepidiphila TaxID=2315841 RepID=UPI001F0C4B79|nr:hypothetical protein [Caldimonas tepidiphila]
MPNDPVAECANAHWTQMVDQCCGAPAPSRGPRPKTAGPPLPGRPLPPSPDGAQDERERLRERLPRVERLLASRRADLLSEQEVERYVALDWLEWHGGTLRLTVVGRNLCSRQGAALR